MDTSTFLELGVKLAGAVVAIMEWLKQTIIKPYFLNRYKDDPLAGDLLYTRVVYAVSVIVGIIVAVLNYMATGQGDIFGAVSLGWEFPPIIGVLIFGIFISFGNAIFHQMFNLLQGIADFFKVRSGVVTALSDETETF